MTKHLLSALTLPALALAACSPQSGTVQNTTNETVTVTQSTNVTTPEPVNTVVPAPADANTLTANGLGKLTIGMSRADLIAAVGGSNAANAEPEACEQFHPARAPAGVLVMLEQGKLTRISLTRDATTRTDAGLGLGATAAAVKTAYGSKAVATPHKYVEPPAEYVTVWSTGTGGPGSLGFVYEIGGDGKVTAIHAGGPAIQYVEGCA